jgi:hypothetical protein
VQDVLEEAQGQDVQEGYQERRRPQERSDAGECHERKGKIYVYGALSNAWAWLFNDYSSAGGKPIGCTLIFYLYINSHVVLSNVSVTFMQVNCDVILKAPYRARQVVDVRSDVIGVTEVFKPNGAWLVSSHNWSAI